MKAKPPSRPIEILLIEDHPADVRMTREALEAARVQHRLHVVEDASEAIAFLYHEGRFIGVPEPDLVLLDLQTSSVDGYEILLEIKSNARLEHIPVVVLSSSRIERDTQNYQWNADCVVTKPAGVDAFAAELKIVETLAVH